jgi:hypothetical protein
MTRARGQQSRTSLNRDYPHRELILAETLRGKMLDQIVRFHANLVIPVKSSSIRKNDTW